MSSSTRTHTATAALWVVFFVNGAVLASWAPRIPQVKSDLALTDGQMGWALLGVALGSVPALIGTGRLLQAVPPRTVCITTALGFPAALPLLASAPNGWTLGAALAVLGAASGCLDVAMNTAAIDYQNRAGVRLLSRFHGGYSLGVLAGAASGAVASAFEVTVAAHFVAVGVALVLLAAVVVRLLPASPTPTKAVPSVGVVEDKASAAGREGRLLVIPASIGVMAIAALLVEGMVTDWSALVVSRDLGGGATLGATAVVVFSVAMFLSRSFGDLIVEELGARRTVCVAGTVVGAAVVVGIGIQSTPWGAVAAVGVVGFALGPLFPLLITEAGRRTRAGAAVATARVSAIGYGAYLGGPPLVGFLADHTGLTTSFVSISCLCFTALAVGSMKLYGNRTSSGVALDQLVGR